MTADNETSPTNTNGHRGDPPARRPAALRDRYIRSLDPGSAVRFGNQRLAATAYAGSSLLIRPSGDEKLIKQRLTDAADAHDLDIDINDVDERLREMAAEAGISAADAQPLILRATLMPRYRNQPASPPDAWPVVQSYRAMFSAGDPERYAVQVDHVLKSHVDATDDDEPTSENAFPGDVPAIRAEGIIGTPYIQLPGTATPYIQLPGTGNPYIQLPGTGNPYIQLPGTARTGPELEEYGIAGSGGRMPVTWVGPKPSRTPKDWLDGRRPVVAIVDTGVGDHDWLPDGSIRDGQRTEKIVDKAPMCGDLPIGLTDASTAPDNPRVRINPLVGGLDATAGHGTFIAGLIRQTCPDANILAVRVIQGDGSVAEADLLEALNKLWLRQELAIRQNRPDLLVDVVSISLGYYHEEFADAEYDPFLLAPIRALARLGVLIVTSSGNDATNRPMYPAAFGPWFGGLVKTLSADELPVVAVGAHNPDGSIALFSNEGPWVSAHRPGSGLVSTMPPFDGSRSPTAELRRSGQLRATIDPDDFRSGFGIWSGTSFAAPVLAGELAANLFEYESLGEDVDPERALHRAWHALTAVVPTLKRPKRNPKRDRPDTGADTEQPTTEPDAVADTSAGAPA